MIAYIFYMCFLLNVADKIGSNTLRYFNDILEQRLLTPKVN